MKAPKNRTSRKALAWMDFYLGESAMNAVEAAKKAGFKDPQTAGPYLLRKYSQAIQDRIDKAHEAAVAKPPEILRIWSDTMRNPDHRDQIKASELLARAHGMLSEKLDIRVSRADLIKDLSSTVEAIITSTQKQLT